jgi:tetratricopeptide (TPR) repeat protein
MADADKATVSVAVVGAANLTLKGTSGVWAIVGLAGELLGRTDTVASTAAPRWGKTFLLSPESPLEEVAVSIWGKDGQYDVFLGEASIPWTMANGTVPGGLELSALFLLSRRRTDPVDVAPTGEVQLRIKYRYPASWSCVFAGVESYERGEFPAAIAHFTAAIQAFPEHYLLWGFRAAAFTDALRYTDAHADAQRVIELAPNRAEGYLRLGNVMVQCDEFDKAKEAYMTALKLEPSHDLTVEALREMDRKRKLAHLKRNVAEARAAFDKSNHFAAVELLTQCLELNPKNVAYLVYRALVRTAQGDLVAAQEDAGKIVQVDSRYPRDDLIVAGFLQKQGQGLAASWKLRYFVLKERFLWYFKTQTDLIPIDVVLLPPGFEVKARAKSPDKFQLILARRVYNLRCASGAERDRWVEMLGSLARLPVTLPHYEREKLVFSGRDLVGPNGSGSVSMKPVGAAGSVISLVSGVVHSGMLYKAGRINTAAKLRWCVIKDYTLYYFNKKEATREAAVYGAIPLHGCQLSVAEDSTTAFSLIAPDRVYYLRAPNPEECAAWTKVLREQTLGTVNRFDEDDDNPEKERAKKQFSSVAVVATSPTQQQSTTAAPGALGFGDMMGGHSPSRMSVMPAQEQGSHNGSQEYRRDARSPAPLHRSQAQSSESRFFERVGLPPPASPDSSRTSSSSVNNRVRESDSEFVSDSETDDEKANLLGQVASEGHMVRRGTAPSSPQQKHQQARQKQQRQAAREEPEEEKESDCCCTVL